jgi:orotate phosphoribosyltransferase
VADLDAAKRILLGELREHSLVIGEVTLASGTVAQYYVDARRTLMRPGGFRAA